VTSGESAGFARRLAALAYDWLVLLGVLLLFTAPVVMWVAHGELTYQGIGAWVYLYRAALLAILCGYYLLNWLKSGQTLGMRAWRLRVVSDAGAPLSWRPALKRLLFSVPAWGLAGLGVLWLYFDAEHVALQDRLSNTRVVHLTRS
jgi:uncharacterized RDD family membrane protein YckC